MRARFELAPDARWHDGRPVTADDVKFTFETVLVKHHARTRASLGPVLDAIDVLGPTSLEFRLKRPYPALLQQLDVTEAPILPRHVYGEGEIEKNPANLKPVGSAPIVSRAMPRTTASCWRATATTSSRACLGSIGLCFVSFPTPPRRRRH